MPRKNFDHGEALRRVKNVGRTTQTGSGGERGLHTTAFIAAAFR